MKKKKMKLWTMMQRFEVACRNYEIVGALDPEIMDDVRKEYRVMRRWVKSYCDGKRVRL